jgi:hypothetical protein
VTIAHQMQHIDFVENLPTFYFGEPYNPLIFHFGSIQGSIIAPPNLHQNDTNSKHFNNVNEN